MPLPYDPNEPLRFDMILPNGEPLRWNTPGARWGGTVGEVMAAIGQQAQTMSTQNIVTGTFSSAQRTAIEAAVQTILENLPFAVDLSVQQRHELLKLGDKSLAFVQRAKELAEQNPAWLPPTFPRQEFISDVNLFDGLGPVVALFTTLLEKATDTRMAAGSDAMTSALILYGIAKAAGAGSNLDDLLQQMGGRFAKKKKATTTPTPPTT